MSSRSPLSTKLFVNLLLALIGVAVALVLLELGLRLANDPSGDVDALHITCGDCPYLYDVNPYHPNAPFREKLNGYSIEELQSTYNIMVLGDSVAYGFGVPYDDAFPQRLERLLDTDSRDAVVFNSAVTGYTPFNQLHQYKSRAENVSLDLVIVTFVMNDVVDPELHWNYTKDAIEDIPAEAYPNPQYHESHVLPILETRRKRSPLANTKLGQRIETAINVANITEQEASYAVVDGRRWPTYITGEDTISIEVLTAYDSPEWVWLRGMYDQIAQEAGADGAQLVLVFVPLSYQMDEQYPFLPQNLLARYCQEHSLLCLDLLPTFREHQGEDLFLGHHSGYLDVWHLSDRGHILVADELRRFLEEHDLIEQR
jgi:lysophospholipase L1-like esterase